MSRQLRWTGLKWAIWSSLALVCWTPAHAQITAPRTTSAGINRSATLEEQLINRLRATTKDQMDYVKFVVKKVQAGELELKLVIAIERYALRRNPKFPLPYFARALRYEAAKRKVALPTVEEFALINPAR